MSQALELIRYIVFGIIGAFILELIVTRVSRAFNLGVYTQVGLQLVLNFVLVLSIERYFPDFIQSQNLSIIFPALLFSAQFGMYNNISKIFNQWHLGGN